MTRSDAVEKLPAWMIKRITFSSGCWIWHGAITRDGYGYISFDGKRSNAHRVIYLLLCGRIPKDLTCDHLCRNRACVRPDHVELVTAGENVLRGEGPSARNLRKRACQNGHAFTAANTYTYRSRTNSTMRMCRACDRQRHYERYRRISRVAKEKEGA